MGWAVIDRDGEGQQMHWIITLAFGKELSTFIVYFLTYQNCVYRPRS